MNNTRIYFDHEKLIAYQRSIPFVAWASHWLEELPAKLAVADQRDRASTSVPLNLAEANAKFVLVGLDQKQCAGSPGRRAAALRHFNPALRARARA